MAGSSTANSAQVEQQNCNPVLLTQKWEFIDTTNGYYRIRNLNAGKCLNVQGGSAANSAKIIIFPCGGSGATNDQWFPRFQWEDILCGDGIFCHYVDFYQLLSRHSGKCANIQGGSLAHGADLIQFSCYSPVFNDLFTWQRW